MVICLLLSKENGGKFFGIDERVFMFMLFRKVFIMYVFVILLINCWWDLLNYNCKV